MPDWTVNRRGEAVVRRLYSPRYGQYLPRVFPFRIRVAEDGVNGVIGVLLEDHIYGYCVVKNERDTYDRVQIWLSTLTAEYLVEYGVIFEEQLEVMEV